MVSTVTLGEATRTKIEPILDYPCLTNVQGYCFEKGEFNFMVTLPIIDTSYLMVYQRCCREAIITSKDSIGSTYLLEITAAGQRLCNSSPRMDDFFPVVTCLSQNYLHAFKINDADNDSVSYYLCSPLKGGGPNLNYKLPNGLTPDPETFPPFDTLDYTSPFSYQNPSKFSKPLQINNNILTFQPEIRGRFIMALCLEDFRQGVLLSRSILDQSFIIRECPPMVRASVLGEPRAKFDTFRINLCNPGNHELHNTSTMEENLKQWKWEFEIDGEKKILYTWNAALHFPAQGTYYGRLTLNEFETCKDTSIIEVNITNNISVFFTIDGLNCQKSDLKFTPTTGTNSPIKSRVWSISPGNQQFHVDTLVHNFKKPDRYKVTLEVADSSGCRGSYNVDIDYLPLDSSVFQDLPPLIICAPDTVKLFPPSFELNENYSVNWNYESGMSTSTNPTLLFKDTGTYDLTYRIMTTFGCILEGKYPGYIQVYSAPSLDIISSNEDKLLQLNIFSNSALDYIQWELNGNTIGTDQQLSYEVNKYGQYLVTLQATDIYGCQNSTSKFMNILPSAALFIPNIFSPNQDGQNDVWLPWLPTNGLKSYALSIFDRWGKLIFSSNNPLVGWDGRVSNKDVQTGVYAY